MKRLIPFILLNIVISAATTLLVLWWWDLNHAPAVPDVQLPVVSAGESENPGQPAPTPTLPPLDQPVLEIKTVIGAGDLENEVIVIRRLGEGDLDLLGWQLVDEQGNRYTFPELVLAPGGQVNLNSRPGTSTVTDLFWGADKPVWEAGERVIIRDPQGNVRAEYRVVGPGG